MKEEEILQYVDIIDKVKENLLFKENVQNNVFNVLYASFSSANPLNADIMFFAKYTINGISFEYRKTFYYTIPKEKMINELYLDIALKLSKAILDSIVNKTF